MTWGKPTEVLSLDPQHSGDGTSWDLFFLVYEQLLSTDDNYHLTPALAESWEQLSPTSYRFHLAKNAAFSNGRALTADDVVGSFKLLSDPAKGGVWGKQLGKIADIVAEDDHTVRFDLAEPNAAFLAVLAAPPASILPIKEIKDGSFDPKKGLLGSGPYKVAEHVQDQYWRLSRNEHYRKPGLPTGTRSSSSTQPKKRSHCGVGERGSSRTVELRRGHARSPRLALPGIDEQWNCMGLDQAPEAANGC